MLSFLSAWVLMTLFYLVAGIELSFSFLSVERYLEEHLQSLLHVRVLLNLHHHLLDIVVIVGHFGVQIIQNILFIIHWRVSRCRREHFLILNLTQDYVPDFHKTFRIGLSILPLGLLQLSRLDWVIKLASLAVRAVQVGVEVLALLRPVVGRDVRLLQQLVAAVSESTFHAKFTFTV